MTIGRSDAIKRSVQMISCAALVGRVEENRRAVLRAHVVALAVERGRVVHGEEYFQNLAKVTTDGSR